MDEKMDEKHKEDNSICLGNWLLIADAFRLKYVYQTG